MEHEAERASILDDVAAIFQEVFAFDAWGRMLVSLARDGQGELRVADVDVEEVVDEGPEFVGASRIECAGHGGGADAHAGRSAGRGAAARRGRTTERSEAENGGAG